MTTLRISARRAACLFAVATSAAAIGCSSQQTRVAGYRANPSPSEDTAAQSHDAIDNSLTVNVDTNFRLMNEDIGRFFLLDRPSRLSPRSIPY